MLQMQRHLQERLQERFLERERIARELHDTLIQGFQGLVLLFGAISQRLPQEDPVRELLGGALTRANEVLAEGRDRVKGLRHSLGLQHDLPAALREVAEDLSRVHSVESTTSVIGTPRELRSDVMDETYQVGREALTNAYRHAAATRVQVEVIFSDSGLHLRVTDNGVGMDARILHDGGICGHFGIQGMHERARKMRGTLHLRSGPGSGTEVELEVPSANAYRKERKGIWW
jgi:signal transduction histidine kinase